MEKNYNPWITVQIRYEGLPGVTVRIIFYFRSATRAHCFHSFVLSFYLAIHADYSCSVNLQRGISTVSILADYVRFLRIFCLILSV